MGPIATLRGVETVEWIGLGSLFVVPFGFTIWVYFRQSQADRHRSSADKDWQPFEDDPPPSTRS